MGVVVGAWKVPKIKETWNFENYLGGGNSNICYFQPYLGKIPILTNIFPRGWNHQLDKKGAIYKEPIESNENSMGRLLYIYLHEWLISMVNVGKYTQNPQNHKVT